MWKSFLTVLGACVTFLTLFGHVSLVDASLSPGYDAQAKAIRLQKCLPADDFNVTKIPMLLYDLQAHSKQAQVHRFYNETTFHYVPPSGLTNDAGTFSCPNGTEEAEFHLEVNKTPKKQRQYFLPNGYLRLFDEVENVSSFIPPSLYCVGRIYEEFVEGTACIPTENSTLPRIRRCTAAFPSLKVTFHLIGEEPNVTLETKLLPVDNPDPWDIYRDTRFSLDESPEQMPVYYHKKMGCKSPSNLFTDPAVTRSVSLIFYTDIQVTKNGKLKGRNSGSENWRPIQPVLDGDDFCIDVGYVTPIAEGNQTAKPEYRRIIRNCPSQERTPSELVNLYHYFILAGMLFLLITLTIYGLVWNQQTVHGKIAAGFVSSMFLFFLSQYLNNVETFEFRSTGCVINGIFQHFVTLSMYSWMTVMNYDVWQALSKVRPASQDKSTKQWIIYCCITYGSAGIIVLISVVLHFSYEIDTEAIIHPQYGFWVCYINFSVYNYYFLPGTLIAFVSSVCFSLLTCKTLFKWSKASKKLTKSKTSCALDNWLLAMKIFILTGISWGLDIAYNATHGLDDEVTVGWWLVDVYNFLQTAFLFWILVVKKEIRNQLCHKYKMAVPIFEFFDRKLGQVKGPRGTSQQTQTASTSSQSHGPQREACDSGSGQA